jgi:hypothetical protein
MNFKAFSKNAVLPSASTSANSAGLPITDAPSAVMKKKSDLLNCISTP